MSDIEFAKKWYQNNVQSGKILLQTDSPTLRASGDTAFFFTNPTWKYYAVNQNGKIKAVDVDLTDSIYTEFVPEENDKAYEETKDWKYRRSYSRMTILQSLQTQQTIGFIMTIIPSPRYVDNRYDRIRFITYLNREPDFDGIILFHNIDGSFSNGWIYENGKVSKRIIEHDADCINNNPSLSINLFKVKYSVRVKEESQDNFRSGEETYDGGTLPEVECVAPYIKRKGYATYDYIYYIENQNSSGIQHQVWWMQEDNLYEGGGGNPPTQPPTNTDENQPCHKINEKLENTAFKDKLHNLREYLITELPNTQIEHGYIENIGSGFIELNPVNEGHSLEFPINKHTTVGYIHNHTQPYTTIAGVGLDRTISPIQIFSPADLIKFLQMAHATSYNGIPTEDIYGAVVTTYCTYILKFTGNPADIINIPNSNELKKYYLEYFTKLYPDNLEEAFLNFLKDKIPVSGIQLLKIDNYNNIINQSLK